jgi:ABC-2 type transport system permease protein
MILLLGPLLGVGQQIAAGRLNSTLNGQRISVLVVAFLPFFFFYMQSVKLFWRLLAEIQTGTIEQVHLSPLPSWLVAAAGRLVAAITETIFLMGITYSAISAFVTLHFRWTVAALLPATFLVITGIGYSLIIGGMTLLRKRIQLLQEGVLMLVMVFAFAALPVFTVPGWFAGLGRVFPLTSSVTSLYGVTLGHCGVTGAWGTGGLAWLIGTAARLARSRHPHLHRAGARHQGARHTRRLLMPPSPDNHVKQTAAMFPAEIQAMVSFMRAILHERHSRSRAEDHPSPCPAFQPPDTGQTDPHPSWHLPRWHRFRHP